MGKIILQPRSIRSKHFLLWYILLLSFFSPFLPSNNLVCCRCIIDITRKIEGTIISRRGNGDFYDYRTNFIIRCNVTVIYVEWNQVSSILSHPAKIKEGGAREIFIRANSRSYFFLLERTFIA